MKKYIYILSVFFLLNSCTERKEETTISSVTEKNLAATEEINKAIKTGDVSKLNQYIATDAVDHASPAGDLKGSDSIIAMLGSIHKMADNMNMEIIKTLADNDYVFQWMRLTGTTKTVDMGMPVGTNYDVNAIQVTRWKDGKVQEHWEFLQPADMARMMSAPPAQSVTDTVKTN